MSPPSKFELPGLGVTLPFFLRRIWASLRPRSGAAERMAYDPAAILRDPSLTWIGHSTFLVRMDGVAFMTDPVFSERASPFSFMGPRRMVPPGLPLEAVPRLNFVLLTHDHYDHTDRPTVMQLARTGVPFVVPRGLADWVRGAGGNAIELEWWQETELDGVRITCVPARHFSGRSLRDRNQRHWCGWAVRGNTRRFYDAGDTAYPDHFQEIGSRLGPFDLATVPIGAYLPAAVMKPVHTTPEEGFQIGKDVGARTIVAMHFGTFDLSDEAVDEPARRFRAEADRQGWRPDRAWIMKVGETRPW